MTKRDTLLDALNRLGADAPVFAVLDGARFDNLPLALRDAGLPERPLYLDRGDNHPERLVTAPYLLAIDSPARRDQVLDLLGDRPGAVFWRCETGEDALYRHLRGINMVMIPKDAAFDDDLDAEDEDAFRDPDDDTPPETHRMVLFRHADANVMAQILPGLEDADVARLLGPANLVLFAPDEAYRAGLPLWYIRRPLGVEASPGPMRFSEDAIYGIDAAQLDASRASIIEGLKEVAPEYTDVLADDGLKDLVTRSEAIGNGLGFGSERAHFYWAFLALITGGDTLENRQVLAHFDQTETDPEILLEELYYQIVNATDEDLEAL